MKFHVNRHAVAQNPSYGNPLMSAPFVSVVIPGYNCASFIRTTLESVIAQNYPNFETIFVDDGSTDDTAAALAPLRDKIVYHRQPNGGLATARNAGLQLARGEYIAWLDADDLCDPDRLLVQAAYLASHPEVVAISTNFAAFDDADGVFDLSHAGRYYTQVRKYGLSDLFPKVSDFDGAELDWLPRRLPKSFRVYSGDVWRRIVLGNFMHPPTLMIRKDACDRAGQERLDLKGAEDWEYIIRLAKLGEFAFIDDALLQYRYHHGQMSSPRSAVLSPLANIAIVKTTMADAKVRSDPELRRALDQALAEFHSDAAYILSEIAPMQALTHMVQAWKSPQNRKNVPRLLARIALPRAGFRLLRTLRPHDSTAFQRR